MALVKRGRPQHVDRQLHFRQCCFWGTIHNSSSCCFIGPIVVWICLHPVGSVVYFGAGSSNSGCAWYAELRLIYKEKQKCTPAVRSKTLSKLIFASCV